MRACAEGVYQYEPFDVPEPEWVEGDLERVAVEQRCDFRGAWLRLELSQSLALLRFWPMMGLLLVFARLCDPASELKLAEHSFASGALGDLVGIPADTVDEDRHYLALDKLLPHKRHWARCFPSGVPRATSI